MTVDEALKVMEAVPDRSVELMMMVDGELVPAAFSEALVTVHDKDVSFLLVEEESRE